MAALQYTVYNAVRLAGNNPKMEGRPIEDFIPRWLVDETKDEDELSDLATKAAFIFGNMFESGE